MDLRRRNKLYAWIPLLMGLAGGVLCARFLGGNSDVEAGDLISFPGPSGDRKAPSISKASEPALPADIADGLRSRESWPAAEAIKKLEMTGREPPIHLRRLLDNALADGAVLARSDEKGTFSASSRWIETLYPEVRIARRSPKLLPRLIEKHVERPEILNLILRQIRTGAIKVPENLRGGVVTAIGKALGPRRKVPGRNVAMQGVLAIHAVELLGPVRSSNEFWRDALLETLVSAKGARHYDAFAERALDQLRSIHKASPIPDGKIAAIADGMKPSRMTRLLMRPDRKYELQFLVNTSDTRAASERLMQWAEENRALRSRQRALAYTVWGGLDEGGVLRSDRKLLARAKRVLEYQGENSHFSAALLRAPWVFKEIGREVKVPELNEMFNSPALKREEWVMKHRETLIPLTRQAVLDVLSSPTPAVGDGKVGVTTVTAILENLKWPEDPEVMTRLAHWATAEAAPKPIDPHDPEPPYGIRVIVIRTLGALNPRSESAQLTVVRQLSSDLPYAVREEIFEAIKKWDSWTPEAAAELRAVLSENELARSYFNTRLTPKERMKLRTAIANPVAMKDCASSRPLRSWLSGQVPKGRSK